MNRRIPRRRRLAYCYASLPSHSQRSLRQRAAIRDFDEQLKRAETSMLHRKFAIIAIVVGALLLGLTAIVSAEPKSNTFSQDEEAKTMETATFGSGCFWCSEAVFEELKGVDSVISGYAGGRIPNPTYQQVCSGQTGHAEVIQIKYDPEVISFDQLLEVFWKTHDPTTLNRQGADIGTQYRSVIFYHDDVQKEIAEKYKQKLNEAGAFDDPIVTEISPLTKFYPAEDYHQDYFAKNPGQGYCRAVISPKMKKFRVVFKDQLKDK